MLHEALMLEIYRQALNAGALQSGRPRSTESANSSERCPSHDSNNSENGREHKDTVFSSGTGSSSQVLNSSNSTFPAGSQTYPTQPPSMEAYLHMVAAAAQQYGIPFTPNIGGSEVPLTLSDAGPFKMPPQISPTSNYNLEALDFRTNLHGQTHTGEVPLSEDDEEEEDDSVDTDNPLDLSVGTRKRSASHEKDYDANIGSIQVKKMYNSESPTNLEESATIPQLSTPATVPNVNPYLAAVAAANIFRTGQFPDWNGKSDLVVDPLEKMSDIVKSSRKEKSPRTNNNTNNVTNMSVQQQPQSSGPSVSTSLSASSEGITKTRHNIWQSHWQNKGVASSVFRCVWCKQSFPTLEALTTHMKDSKHCGVNVPPFGNLPSNERQQQPSSSPQHPHNYRKQVVGQQNSSASSSTTKNSFQYRGDPPTPLPRKLVRGQNVWLGKGVEQAMQILKCMRCGESFRSLGDMTKHMQETQHYTNILSQEQSLSVKSNSGESKEGQSNLSSEESRTLSAVLTCKVCDKAFNSLGELSNHMAKNNHYAEPLMQSMSGSVGNRKRPAPKKREKSLPVRKLLELKVIKNENETNDNKQQRSYENAKRISMDGTGMGHSNEKSEAVLFAERMRQYISSVKSSEDAVKIIQNPNQMHVKSNTPEIHQKNGTSKASPGTSSVLSAIEQMFTTSFDTPPRHASAPATSPSNCSTKNASPVASSILKRLGIDETVDYNKPLIDTSDPFYQHYRYTSSERSGSECSLEASVEKCKFEGIIPDKNQPVEVCKTVPELPLKTEEKCENPDQKDDSEVVPEEKPKELTSNIKVELGEGEEEENQAFENFNSNLVSTTNGNEKMYKTDKKESDETCIRENPPDRGLSVQSPVNSHRSATPKSPTSSIKSFDGEKKYPSDSLNALSSMFDSLGSSVSGTHNNRSQSINNKIESPENLSACNSLAALRQFCVKKEKTS